MIWFKDRISDAEDVDWKTSRRGMSFAALWSWRWESLEGSIGEDMLIQSRELNVGGELMNGKDDGDDTGLQKKVTIMSTSRQSNRLK